MMWKDEIIDEIRQFREEHAQAFNYDLNAMFVDWKQRQEKSDRKIVSLSPKQKQKNYPQANQN